MWKLFNLVFGWDYVQISSFGYYEICKIHRLPDGFYIKQLRRYTPLKDSKHLIWLTCHPSKYLDA